MTTENDYTETVHDPSKEDELKKVSAGLLITVTALSLKKHFSQAISGAGYQISTEQYAVLSQLWKEDSMSQSDLGRRVFKDRHNVSRIIKSLEQMALVVKKPDARDGRLARCVLTQEGRALCRPLSQISNQVLEKAFEGMGKGEIQWLKKNLIGILQNLGEDLHLT